MKNVSSAWRRTGCKDLVRNETEPITPTTFRPSITYCGSSNQNSISHQILRWCAVAALLVLLVVLFTGPPVIGNFKPSSCLISAVCLTIIGFHSKACGAWPSALVLWLGAVAMMVNLIRG